MNDRKNRKRAFTLIELLVVISIIALLVSILLPALGSARQTAIELQCLTQVRSLGQAVHMYSTDNAQYYPQSIANGLASNDSWSMYHYALNTYMGLDNSWTTTLTSDQYHCPSVFDEATAAQWGDPWYGYWAMYGANPHMMAYGQDAIGTQYNSGSYSRYPGQIKWMKEADNNQSPSEFAMMYDCYRFRSWWPGLYAWTLYTEVSHIMSPHNTRTLMEFRTSSPYGGDHVAGGGRGSIVYADGHADVRLQGDWPNSSSQSDRQDTWVLPN